MGIALKKYKEIFIQRFDKDGFVPYLSYTDYEGLKQNKDSFINSRGNSVSYFLYNYNKYDKDKIILFLHGIGPGHTAYMSEIHNVCLKGYQVLTLDYSGCDSSGGENMYSINSPTRDVVDLLNHLNLKQEIIVIGHSLGGYTALNILNIRDEITRGVVISGFYHIEREMRSFMKLRLLTSEVTRFERSVEPTYYQINNLKFLKDTNKKILFIHSKDDMVVPYKSSCLVIEKLHNPNLSFLVVDYKKHNPNYSLDAVNYMLDTFKVYNKMIKNHEFKDDNERKQWMSSKSLMRMTEQDQDVIDEIIEFIS